MEPEFSRERLGSGTREQSHQAAHIGPPGLKMFLGASKITRSIFFRDMFCFFYLRRAALNDAITSQMYIEKAYRPHLYFLIFILAVHSQRSAYESISGTFSQLGVWLH